MFSAKRKAFTLIEMLIVIVIIGILAAALVPRMMSARDKAADVAVKADLQQIAGAISSYGMDNGGSYAGLTSGAASGLSGTLVPTYLSSMPKDAAKYNYVMVKKGSNLSGGFALYGTVTTAQAANWAAAFGTP
jgi:general secretion pathway protein G